jgi:branched-chain amino acid transport system substrate-binding protein
LKISRRASLGFALALALLPVSGRTAGEPYAIPVIAALTGPFALLGNTQKIALETLQKTVNDGGGINKRPLKFDFIDDAGNAANSVQIMNQLIARKVPLVLGPSSVATCRAVAPLVTAGPVQYCMSPGGATPKDGFSFSAGYSTPDSIRLAVTFFRERGWHKLAILEPTDATGQDGEAALDAALALPENRGVMTVVAREHFNLSDISTAAQLSRIKAQNPDVLFAWATGAPIATVLHGLIDLGYDVPTFTSHGNMLYATMSQYGDLTPKAGLYFAGPQFVAQQFLPKGAARVAVDTFVKAFRTAGLQPDVALSSEWDMGLVVVDTLRHVSPSPTAEQIRAYIAGIHGLAGSSATFDFRDGSQRGISAATILIARWDIPTHTFVAVSAPGGKPLARRP